MIATRRTARGSGSRSLTACAPDRRSRHSLMQLRDDGLLGHLQLRVDPGVRRLGDVHLRFDAGAAGDVAAVPDTGCTEVGSVRREVLPDGEVERAAVAQLLDLLEDALAVGSGPDDRRATVIL